MTSRNLQAPTKYKFLLLTTNTHLQGNRVISHRKGTKHYFLEGWGGGGGGWAFWGMKVFSPLQVVHEFFWWSRAPWLVENSCSIFFPSWFPFHNFLKQFLLCRNIFFLEIATPPPSKKIMVCPWATYITSTECDDNRTLNMQLQHARLVIKWGNQVGTFKGFSSPLQISETRIEGSFCLWDDKISAA